MIKRATRAFLLLTFFIGALFINANAQTGLQQGAIEQISAARQKSTGSVVTVAGRVTVSSQFGGPIFIQDSTAGIAVYNSKIINEVAIGDSVVVTGALSDYYSLLEISENVTFKIASSVHKYVTPKIITVNEVSEQYESQLVTIENASFGSSIIFQGGRNYAITDPTGTMDLRIDNDDTALTGLQSPGTPTNITGVVSEYNGTYEILPRFASDVGAVAYMNPGENVPENLTLDVVTWNLEWFGASGLGPTNDSLQVENVAAVMININADIYALQEVSNAEAFRHLLRLLPGYKGMTASYSQQQKTAFVYRTTTIDSISSGLITDPLDQNFSYDWANGRLPYEFTFEAHIDGQSKIIHMIDIHAKASTSDPAVDYSRRVAASKSLKTYMDRNMSTDNIILLGDYNDDVDTSIYNDSASPYANFVDDPNNYHVVTELLSHEKLASNAHGTEMIDHITISNELFNDFFDSTQTVVMPSYINDYVNTTSDHYPVYARFRFDHLLAVEPGTKSQIPNHFVLNQNYPNPFNPATNISFTLPKAEQVTLKIYNILGQTVTVLIDNQVMSRGSYSISLYANNLPSGIYFYNLQTHDGLSQTRKMILMK